MRRFAALAFAAALSACAPAAPPPPAADPPLTYRPAPQPPGSTLDPPGLQPEGATDTTYAATKWPGSLPPGTEEQRDGAATQRIKQRGRIIVGVDQSQYLLSYRDATHGEMRGFEVDLAREIAKDLLGDPEKVDFRFVESAARTESLQAHDVDIVIRTMSVTQERAELVEFSTPYLTSYVRVLVPRDRGVESIDQLPGRTICVVDGTNLVNLVRTRFPDSEVLRTRSWSDCLMATQQFQADAVVGDDAVLAGMAAQDPLTQLFPDRLADQLYAVGIPKGQDDLVRQVNSTIERIRSDGTWNRMHATWLGSTLSESWLPRRMYREEDPQ